MTERRRQAEVKQVADGGDGQVDVKQLLDMIEKLSADMRAVKGNLADNTSFTREMLDHQQVARGRQDATDGKLSALVVSTTEMMNLFEAGKKGVGFFQWIGRAIFRLASWLRPVLIAGGLVWALLHGQWPKGGE